MNENEYKYLMLLLIIGGITIRGRSAELREQENRRTNIESQYVCLCVKIKISASICSGKEFFEEDTC